MTEAGNYYSKLRELLSPHLSAQLPDNEISYTQFLRLHSGLLGSFLRLRWTFRIFFCAALDFQEFFVLALQRNPPSGLFLYIKTIGN